MKRKTLETAVIAAALAASLLTGCSKPAEETTAAAEKQESKADAGQEKKESPEKLEELTVGASPAPHAEILEAAREVLASKGYDLKIVEYTDYVLPVIWMQTISSTSLIWIPLMPRTAQSFPVWR